MTSILVTNPSSIPLSQNTAPVHEHRCLYTHDVRRKAKRWQDGFLRFHTFNNRVMIYDVPRNFIGDTHYQDGGSEGLADGDELTLERTGVLIQVGERLETQQTDISGIVSKRAPKPLDNEMHNGGTTNHVHRNKDLLQPRSSNIPRTPGRYTGWTGRAQIPQESPFAQKQAAVVVERHQEQGRPSKRQRRDDEHIPLWEILKTTRLSRQVENPGQRQRDSTLGRTLEPRAKAPRSAAKGKNDDLDGQGRLKVKEVIDITSSAENMTDSRNQGRNRTRPGEVQNSSSPTRQALDRVGLLNQKQSNLPPRHVEKSIPQRLPIPQPKSPKNAPLQLNQCPRVVEPARSYRNQVKPHERPTDENHNLQQNAGIARAPVLQQGILHSNTSTTISRKSYTANPKSKSLGSPVSSPSALTSNKSLQSSLPVSTTNHLPPNNNNQNTEHIDKDSTENAEKTLPHKSPIKPLRLNSKPARKMLICETVPAANVIGTSRQQRVDNNPITELSSSPVGVLVAKTTLPLRKDINSGMKDSVMESEDTLDSTFANELLDTPSSVLRPTTVPNDSIPAIPNLTRNMTPVIGPINTRPEPQPHPNPAPHQPADERQQRYKTKPPDYSRLDAQLLHEQTHTTSAITTTTTSATNPATKAITQPSKVHARAHTPPALTGRRSVPPLQPVATTTTTTTIPPHMPPTTKNNNITAKTTNTTTNHRPFRRHTSDTTHISPTELSNPNPDRILHLQHQNKPSTTTTTSAAARKPTAALLRRAETISGTTTFGTGARNTAFARRVNAATGRATSGADMEREAQVHVDATETGTGTSSEENTGGPWSREAWDLFGWIPVSKISLNSGV